MMKQDSERSVNVLQEKRATLRMLLQYLEEALGDEPYFLGGFSLTDIAIVPRFLRMEAYGAMPAPMLPKLNAWLQRMKERSSVKAVLAQTG
jgi:glutathione S-transferase